MVRKRNYSKETDWDKNTYDRITIKLKKGTKDKLKKYTAEDGTDMSNFLKDFIYNYIEKKEKLKMEEMIKDLKEELLNKEMTLLEMDNEAERITGSTTSLFDAESDCIEQKSCAYYIDTDKNIVVEFEIINKNDEDNKETLIKVVDIWED